MQKAIKKGVSPLDKNKKIKNEEVFYSIIPFSHGVDGSLLR
ncbi:hypothetical protein HMPREF9303_2617 [Prevotella denticola CRIS 18C-A]|uniref:Uncharacterized protein n=1 Tax=Prevotella denticola CRIS 18C-A TaxID=944557 RepID=F0H8W5_9BACT|nr:hypothetical protein HMPREF9303_2617 [Prevotella denticola CRIS 18C-A]